MHVKHEPLQLIPPQFETPLPPLQPAVRCVFIKLDTRLFHTTQAVKTSRPKHTVVLEINCHVLIIWHLSDKKVLKRVQ
jgi:hypothetical protein